MEPQRRLELAPQDRVGRRRLRHPARGRRHRPAGDAGGRRAAGGHAVHRDRAPDPRRPRREHDLRRLEHVVRAAAAGTCSGPAFLGIAASHGLTSAIMDARAPVCVEAVRAADFLLGHDEWGARWIAAHRAKLAAAAGRRERRDAKPPSRPAPAACGCSSAPTAATCACPPGRRSSTPRPGTGSRSTPPAAATAPARSARSGSCPARCRSTPSTRARSRSTSSRAAGGWPAARRPPRTSRSTCRRCRRGPRRRWSASAGTSSCARRCRSATSSSRSPRSRTRSPTSSGCSPPSTTTSCASTPGRCACSAARCGRPTSR